jgi:hypothetical protein
MIYIAECVSLFTHVGGCQCQDSSSLDTHHFARIRLSCLSKLGFIRMPLLSSNTAPVTLTI